MAGSLKITVALLNSLIIRCNQGGRGMIGHTNIRRDNLILVCGVIYKLAKIIHKLNLRVYLSKLSLVLGALSKRLGSIHLELGNRVALLIALQGTFGGAKLGINLLQTRVDKLLGLHGNLVLIDISLTVITYSQLAKIIETTTGVLISKRELGNRGLLRGWRNIDGLGVACSYSHRGQDSGYITVAIVHTLLAFRYQGEHAIISAHCGGKLGYGLREITILLTVKHGLALNLVLVALASNL